MWAEAGEEEKSSMGSSSTFSLERRSPKSSTGSSTAASQAEQGLIRSSSREQDSPLAPKSKLEGSEQGKFCACCRPDCSSDLLLRFAGGVASHTTASTRSALGPSLSEDVSSCVGATGSSSEQTTQSGSEHNLGSEQKVLRLGCSTLSIPGSGIVTI